MLPDTMPLRIGALLLLLACAASYIAPRLACDVPLGENCGTDTECECMYGSNHR
jgi:hypothetical protein